MAHYKINSERKKIEIYFSKKPSSSVRDYMKSNGWRWNPYDKYWFHYNSAHNRDIADTICLMDGSISGETTAKQEEKVQKPKPTPAPKPKIEPAPVPVAKPLFSAGDEVVFRKDDFLYLGTVIEYNSELHEAFLSFQREFIPFGLGAHEYAYVSILDIVKPYVNHPHWVYGGQCVEYLTEKLGVRHAYVSNSHYGSPDLFFYLVDENGYIQRYEETSVSSKRIVDTLTGPPPDFFPVSKGERVEFEDPDGQKTVGKIIDISYDGRKAEIEYYESFSRNEKYKRYIDCDLTDVRKLRTADGKLRREDYISAVDQRDIDYNARIKHRIQERQDQFYEITRDIAKKPLYRHQRAGCMLAERYNKFAFFYDTGTGKTVMALNIIQNKHRSNNARFLIIAPKSIIKTAWLDDAANFFPEMRILPLYKGFTAQKKRTLLRAWRTGHSRSTAESDKVFMAHVRFLGELLDIEDSESFSNEYVAEELQKSAQHYIINSELFIQDPERYIKELGITGIIMDESAIMKNYHSVTSKAMRTVCEKLQFVYLLSGKPAPNNEIEFFSQMKIVAPEIFPFSYDRFLQTFCITKGYKQMLDPKNQDLFAEMVSSKSLIISKKDCLDLPGTVEVVRLIDLPPSIMDDYNELYYQCMVIIKGMDQSSTYYSSHSKMAILMKLRQMASGFFMKYSEHGSEQRIIIDIHNAKVAEVKAILDDIPDEQVIIWCQFQHEIELLEKELSEYGVVVTAYGKTKKLEENIDAFKNGRAKYILAHPKTLKYGVTFTNCKYAIYYSFSYSAEDYDQSHDRNYRLGQTESCTYFFIQSADTIDEIMYSKVMEKLTNAEFFERMVKDAAKHGINYYELKGLSDEEIRKEIQHTATEGNLAALESKIVEKSEQRAKEATQVSTAVPMVPDDEDYWDYIDGPSDYELAEIERIFNPEMLKREPLMLGLREKPKKYKAVNISKKGTTSFADMASQIPITVPGIYALDPNLFDFSRAIFADQWETAEAEISLTTADDDDDFVEFIRTHPVHAPWVVDMYRLVFNALYEFPEYMREMVILRYGLEDGIPRNFKSISNTIGYYTYEGKFYTCYPYKVSQVVSEVMEEFKSHLKRYHFDRYAHEVRKIIG